jgi:RND superfamily putative drug exporter
LGVFAYRRRWRVLATAALLLALAALSLAAGGRLTAGSIGGLEAEQAEQLASWVTGRDARTTVVLWFHSEREVPGTEAFDTALESTLSALRSDPRVAFVDAPQGPQVARADHAAYAVVTLKGDERQAQEQWPKVRARLPQVPLEVLATGPPAVHAELGQALEHDLHVAELASLPLALLILVLAFRSLVAAVLPVLVGGLAVACGIAVVLVLSRVVDVSQYTLNVCSLVGLGVAIDYSLFMVSRFREELAKGYSTSTALARAVEHAGRVVAFSALVVCAGLGGLLFFERSYLRAMGLGGAIVVAFAAGFALTVLPALLALLGHRIDALPLKLPSWHGRGWTKIATWVMRRPALVLVAVLGVLGIISAPALSLRVAALDVRALPKELEARRAFEHLQSAFPEAAGAQVLVAVEFPPGATLDRARAGALYDLSARLAALPNVAKVESLAFGQGLSREAWQQLLDAPPAAAAPGIARAKAALMRDNVTLVRVSSRAGPTSEAARQIVRRVRAERRVGDGRLKVGGPTAADLDVSRYLAERTPRAAAFVLTTTFVLLLLLLGSVLLPLKATLMNCLSVAAAFGALVWLFQEGHLGLPAQPLEPAIPMLLFCVLFGLSMDYELLILSRMKEAWERGHDNPRAVALGLEKSGGLVTSAATIMVAVFAAFSLARVVLIRAIGVGMAIAVLIDATLVRVLMVPAAMRLLGRWNWYEPGWLAALRRALGLAGGVGHGSEPPPRASPTAR